LLGILQVGFVTSTRLFAFWGMFVAMELNTTTMCMAGAAIMRQQSRAIAVLVFTMLILLSTCGFTITKSW
jgi:hypothetical protein